MLPGRENAPDFEPLTPEKRNRGTPIDPVGAKRTESPLVKDTVGASGAESRLGKFISLKTHLWRGPPYLLASHPQADTPNRG